jgi:2-polyprenyl-3-methyl-5-hydroxy-6-metoxy-1,4-benzoquinol methylase
MTKELRFGFGKNWENFLQHLDESRVEEAMRSLKDYLGVDSLAGKTFLDVGSGSGLFSLAAHKLGATVKSFDYDENSVNCTQYLRDTYAPGSSWEVFQGSILDDDLVKKLGTYDIVYSWGVLHHTGNMLRAFENVEKLVKSTGVLFISIYNDQGGASRRWLAVKKRYNQSGFFGKKILELYTLFRQWSITFIKDFLRSGNPFKRWINYAKNNRGMSAYHDLIDWVGGYPFEVAKPEKIFNFFKKHHFELCYLSTCAGGFGCNQFVFQRKKFNPTEGDPTP